MIDTDNDLRPWVPEGARPFQVGDRVRGVHSPECSWIAEYPGLEVPVITGTVYDLTSETMEFFIPNHHEHSVIVKLDARVLCFGQMNNFGRYAPSELELLEAAR